MGYHSSSSGRLSLVTLALVAAVLAVLAPGAASAARNGGGDTGATLVVERAVRKIRLTTHHSRTHTTLTLRNDGKAPVSHFSYAVHASQAPHIALVTALGAGKKTLAVAREGDAVDRKTGQLYRVTLETPLAPGAKAAVKVSTVATGLQEPHPVEIAQTARQYVRYYDNHYVWTPYRVEHQQTEVKLATSAIESHTQARPTAVRGDTITYGPYTAATAAYKRSKLAVHFQNNSPFATADRVVKEVEVSHWGNVAVTEEYKIVHTGARLKGGFSRIDYNKAPGASGVNAIVSLRGKLPYGAADVYYRDLIGNVSTSRIHGVYPKTEIELVPRFPVFGGWRDHFEVACLFVFGFLGLFFFWFLLLGRILLLSLVIV
jgi:oligosaccharyltransferase complex subunit alpha (ribophorin I)